MNHANKVIEQEEIKYSLNDEEKTASIIGYNEQHNKEDYIIPRSINFKSTEYIIKKIDKNAFRNSKIKSIDFADDSELEIIESDSFGRSYFEKLVIPSSLIELKTGWCNDTDKLKTIHIKPNNQNYILYQDAFILTKSNSEKKDYDVLVFCRRDVQEVKIPEFIEIIGSYSFNSKSIQKVDFSNDSKLRIIESFAFLNSSIKSLSIPPNKIDFQEGWCKGTSELNEFNLTENNPHFLNYENQFILIKSAPEKENYDVLLFSVRNITTATIPTFIEKISPYAFHNCRKLQQIKFANQFVFFKRSNLRVIDNYAFYNTMIKKISIPKTVTRIGEFAFSNCEYLKTVDIPSNSELQTVGKYAFNNTIIEMFTIPSDLVELKEGCLLTPSNIKKFSIKSDNKNFMIYNSEFILGKSEPEKENFDVILYYFSEQEKTTIPNFIEVIGSFAFNNKLKCVEFEADSKLRIIDNFAFLKSKIESISIPSNVTVIGGNAFCGCKDLRKVEFQPNSKLQTIGMESFYFSGIEKISIPSSVEKIGPKAFSFCRNLQQIEFGSDSKLERIEHFAFEETSIQKVVIPSSVKIICSNAFHCCREMKEIEIPNDSELRKIEYLAFYFSNVERISIPSKFVEFEEGWCKDVYHLNIMKISSMNQNYKLHGDNLIISKSSHNNDNFDTIVFCNRNVKAITIPKFVEIIEPFAFEHCEKLQNVDFERDSKLRIINRFAFSSALIRRFSIPSSVTFIGYGAFVKSGFLKKVSIPHNSELRTICDAAFIGTSIHSIYVPPKLTRIDESVFYTKSLQIVEYDENLNVELILKLFFSNKNIIFLFPVRLGDKFASALRDMQ